MPASALQSPHAAAAVDLPFPDVSPTDLGAPASDEAPTVVTRGNKPRTEWPPVGPSDEAGVPAAPAARPPRKKTGLSPEARAILEARVPPIPIQILMAPFANRTRRITTTVLTIIVLSILGLNAVIETSRPDENARGPALEVRPGGGLAPVMPDFPGQGPDGARGAPDANGGSKAALGRLSKALLAYGDSHSGLPERLSPDLRELSEIGDLSVELVHFAPDSLSWRHDTRINLNSDSGMLRAKTRSGEDLELAVNWEKKVTPGAPINRR